MEDRAMVKAEANIIINAPVEKVFGLFNETEKLPDWMPLLIEVHDIQGDGVGKKFKWTYKFIGIKFEGMSEIAEQVENKKVVVKSKAGIESIWTWKFSPEGSGTKVDVVVEYTIPVPVLGKFAESFVVKQGTNDVKHTLETLKHVLEA
jgi:coenzyme Q-binding protein COQ10